MILNGEGSGLLGGGVANHVVHYGNLVVVKAKEGLDVVAFH